MKAELVHISKNKPFTDSLVIAEAVGLKHARVIRLIRKYQKDIEELGKVSFENSLNKQGSATEYLNLTEDQATFLMMLFKPSPIVVKFRVQLVKAFRQALNELERIKNQAAEPNWKVNRDETKIGFKWMTENLKEQRERKGKITKSFHFVNEAKLINGVINGVFSRTSRNTLPAQDLKQIGDLQRYNAQLIAQDMPYTQRKACLISYLESKIDCATKSREALNVHNV